jgi:hypothetical protein
MVPARPWYRDLALVVITSAGYLLPFGLLIGGVGGSFLNHLGRVAGLLSPLLGLVVVLAALFAMAKLYQHVRAHGVARLRVAYELLVLAWFPAWGLIVNHILSGTCVRDGCGMDLARPFAEPWVIAPALLHVVTALAFALSRRRPERLRPAVETGVLAAMVTGMVLHVALTIQLGAGFLLMGVVLAPFALPVVSPLLTVLCYATELVVRLRRRGAEESATTETVGAGVYREVEVPGDLDPHQAMSRPWLYRALAGAPVLLGAYAVLSALVTHRALAGALAFTETCEHTFSRLPIQHVPGNCHYLCTVAARGHGWLVRPERLGVRGGETIVVNRQLAVANAFEDLLHVRWPRFGRLCRAVYDRLGLPVSRVIRWRLVADVIYLAMKPAEWAFYAVLLALDPGDPEARIDRMYRR